MKKDPEYLEWLHEVTVAGYDENISICTEHGQFIENQFNNDCSPKEALYNYKSWLAKQVASNNNIVPVCSLCKGDCLPEEQYRFANHILLELPENAERERRIRAGLSTKVCIDPCIVPEIEKLFSAGVVTTGCCCGHKVFEPFVNVASESINKMIELGYQHSTEDPSRTDTFSLKSAPPILKK